MRIAREDFRGRQQVDDLPNALRHALTPDAYSYDGALEKQAARIDKLERLVIDLVGVLRFGDEAQTVAALQVILGHGFEVSKGN